MLFLGSREQHVGKDHYLYVIQTAGAGPVRRRMATSAAGGCLHISIYPVYRDKAPSFGQGCCWVVTDASPFSHQLPALVRSMLLPEVVSFKVIFIIHKPSDAAPSVVPTQCHSTLPTQALPHASGSSAAMTSWGLLVPARIIAYNYSRCAMNSKPLRRKATPIFIPLGNLKLIPANS